MHDLYAVLLVAVFSFSAPFVEKRPNVVWIISVDNSMDQLRRFFAGSAEAWTIEGMAAYGLIFEHVFLNAPACSVACTSLATMCYGPRIGTQFHRRYVVPPLLLGLKMFPADL